MMRLTKIFLTILLANALGGCAHLNRSFLSLPSANTGEKLLIWHPDYSAGIGVDGKVCVQPARTATASSVNAALDVAKEVSAGIGYGEAVRALNPSNPQVTFASNAHFAICQLAANGFILPEAVPDLIRDVTKDALKVSTEHSDGSVTVSPAVTDAVMSVLQRNNVPITKEIEEEISDAVDDVTGAVGSAEETDN